MNGVQRQRRLQPNGISIWLRIFSGIANAMQIVRAWILVDLVQTSHRSLRCGCFRTSQNVMAKCILWNEHVVNETTANEIKPVSHVHVDSVNYYPNEHARRLPDWCNSQVLLTDDDAEEHTAKLSLVWVNDRVMTPTLCHYFDARGIFTVPFKSLSYRSCVHELRRRGPVTHFQSLSTGRARG